MSLGQDGQPLHCSGAGILYRSDAANCGADRSIDNAVAMNDTGEPSDEALMIAYRDGDAAAFTLLYARHRGGLYRYLLRQCGKAAAAEELFQDVWLNLIRARTRYVAEARFATYLYRIAHNRLIDHFRRATLRPAACEDDASETIAELPAERRSQPDARLQGKAAIERFMVLLNGLPEPQREAFVMHEEAGLSVEEIARATGVNTETAKSRLRYALTKLRRGLEEWM
jgi:RNA polymerase sigma-70 factor (ECF subfamily)